MHLTLTVEQCGAEGARSAVRFGTDGGTVGRGSGRDLELPDPECYISSLHAAIAFEDGQFILTDKSTNGTFHNAPDRLIGRDRTAPLASGDRLYIGDYVLVAAIEEERAEPDSPMPESPGTEEQVAESPRPSEAMDAEAFSLPWENEEDLSAGPDEHHDPEATGEDDDADGPDVPNQSPEREFFAAPGARRGDSQLIPEDWDKFLTGFFEPPASEAPGPPDEQPRPEGQPAAEAAPDSGAPETPAATPTGGRNPADEPRDSAGPPQGRGRDLDHDALYRALETATGGLMALLHSRSEIKNEFRIEQTRFIQAENNPLKFSLNAEEAMQRVLGTSDEPGFVTGSQAYREAIDDLQAHQFALMSAVQEAIESAIRQFNPVQLEQRLKKISPLSARTPGLKAARCWGLFTSHYDEVAAALRDDARKVFLQAFADAYERAVREIAARRDDSRD